MGLRFSKMHGLGNDFVIVDCRARPLALDVQAIRTLGDRHFGVGFDQLLTIERARDARCAQGDRAHERNAACARAKERA